MKIAFVVATCVAADSVTPIQKVVQMLSELEQKVIKEGAATQKTYEEFAEWCEDRSRELGFEIKTASAQVEELKATILDSTSKAEALTEKIEDLGGSIAQNEADLKAATEIRTKEKADFQAEEKELTETISALERAIGILEKELASGAASMMQLKSASSLESVFSVMVKGFDLSSADGTRLTAFVQSQADDSDMDDDAGAPAAAAYESKSGSIVDTLEGILEKAEAQLETLRQTETNRQNNFNMLKQSLEDEMKFGTKEKDEAAKALSKTGETKAAATGDLSATSKDLSEDQSDLGKTHQDCMTKAEEFQTEVKDRGEELKALAMAKKAVVDSMSGAAAASFLQTDSDARARLASRFGLANFEAVRFMRDLAKKTNAPELAQLASRMATVYRLEQSSGSRDPFAKVKGLITDMLAKLEKEAAEAADQKAWCDKELTESKAKKEVSSSELEGLSTKIESASSHSAKLKEEVSTLQQELAHLASSQAAADQIRADEKAVYDVTKPEIDAGLKGVKLALKILNDYFAKNADSGSGGAGSGIIGMLEVVESDLTKSLAELQASEDMSEKNNDALTQENYISKKMKEGDVKYKTKEFTGLDKSLTELEADRRGVQAEYDAVIEYLESVTKKCTYKVESYAEKVARRKSEVAGLKEALSILENEVALVQTSSQLRGVRKHL